MSDQGPRTSVSYTVFVPVRLLDSTTHGYGNLPGKGILDCSWGFRIIMQLQLSLPLYSLLSSLGHKHIIMEELFCMEVPSTEPQALDLSFFMQSLRITTLYFAESLRLEMLILLVLYEVYGRSYHDSSLYFFTTFSMWFLVASWLFAPFVLNPSGFDWQQTVDWTDWKRWMGNRCMMNKNISNTQSWWESWWHQYPWEGLDSVPIFS